MMKIKIIDTTLRDGEQTAGVVFLKEEKIHIAKKLDEMGVHIIEVGIPGMGKEEMQRIMEINNLGLRSTILTWNRMKTEDVDHSLSVGVKNVHLAIATSDIQLQHKFNLTKQEVLYLMQKTVEYAVNKGCIVSVGAEDASRTDEKYLMEFFTLAKKAGAQRVRYADTLGILDPLSTYNIIGRIVETLSMDIDFHGHNDFGMATANAFSAYKAGATHISCTVNGLGERAGNTPLEEIIMALEYIAREKTGIDLKKIMEISNLVENVSGRALSLSKPIVGKEAFSHESGIHVDGLLKNRRNYESFDPEDIGRKHHIVIGKFSGSAAIINKYREMGREITNLQSDRILNLLRENYDKSKFVDDKVLLDI
ncbi:MAG: homocitrate synthase [Bacillota bacterium]